MKNKSPKQKFTIPKKIRVTKLIIAIIINFVIGGAMLVFAIYYYIDPYDVNTYLLVFSVFMLIVGALLFLQFPIILIRTYNSLLIVNEKEVIVRNTLNKVKVNWSDIQDVLIRERLTKELGSNELVGLSIIRFRTVTKGIIFIGDNYPAEDSEEIIDSLKKYFEKALQGTSFKLHEKHERPSLTTRFTYLEKMPISENNN